MEATESRIAEEDITMIDSAIEEPKSRLVGMTDSIVTNSLKLEGFVNQIVDRLSNDIKEIDDHLLDRFGPIGKGVSGREMSLLFISELLPIANAVTKIGAERRSVEETIGHIEEQLSKAEHAQEPLYRLHTTAVNVLSVAVLLYLLEACHAYVKKNRKDNPALITQWENIRARTSTRLEEALGTLNGNSGKAE
jgi:hypothetical protein